MCKRGSEGGREGRTSWIGGVAGGQVRKEMRDLRETYLDSKLIRAGSWVETVSFDKLVPEMELNCRARIFFVRYGTAHHNGGLKHPHKRSSAAATQLAGLPRLPPPPHSPNSAVHDPLYPKYASANQASGAAYGPFPSPALLSGASRSPIRHSEAQVSSRLGAAAPALAPAHLHRLRALLPPPRQLGRRRRRAQGSLCSLRRAASPLIELGSRSA
jgi:hypothetical protein